MGDISGARLQSLRELFSAGSPQAVIWDMDGVLSHTMHLHFEALHCACQARQLLFPAEIMQLGTGRADGENIAYILEKNGVRAGASGYPALLSGLKEDKNAVFRQLIAARQVQSTPGVQAWLEALLQRRIPCAVASSSTLDAILQILDRLGFAGYFEAVVSGARLPKSKPHPAIFLQAAGSVGARPQNCLVIEDAPDGVEAALKAGMRCIALGTSIPMARLGQADIVVSDLCVYPPEIAFG